jgi:hypothetical protein
MDKPLPALRALSWGLFRCAARQQVWISDQNATTRQGIGVGIWAGDGRDSLRLPSTEQGPARDGTEGAGTTSDDGSRRQGVCARHERSSGTGGDATGLVGSWRCDL